MNICYSEYHSIINKKAGAIHRSGLFILQLPVCSGQYYLTANCTLRTVNLLIRHQYSVYYVDNAVALVYVSNGDP